MVPRKDVNDPEEVYNYNRNTGDPLGVDEAARDLDGTRNWLESKGVEAREDNENDWTEVEIKPKDDSVSLDTVSINPTQGAIMVKWKGNDEDPNDAKQKMKFRDILMGS